MPGFLEALRNAPLISDGATGTQLAPHADDPAKGYEVLNATKPDAVRQLAATYVAAGSHMITTNSFGGTRIKLTAAELGDRVRELNTSAAQLAREGARPETVISGCIGPMGKFLEPIGEVPESDAVGAFAEQASALAAGGADLILIETMMSLEEALAAVRGAQEATSLPVAATMAFVMTGKTMFGVSPAQAVEALEGQGVAALGLNCGELTFDRALSLIEEFAAIASVPVIAQPNAGIPELIQGVAQFKETPESMGAYARRFVEAGASIVGGCCGSTPDHIRAIAQGLRP